MALVNFAGLASGIDSNALIDAITEATRSQRVKPHEEKISKLTETNDSFSEMKSKATALRDLLANYTSSLGGVLTKQVTSSDETIASGVATSQATNGTYSVTVTQLAKNANFSFDDVLTTPDDVIDPALSPGGTDTLTIEIGTGSDLVTTLIDIDEFTTWNGLASTINADPTIQDRVVASIVNVGTTAAPSYRLMLTGLETGTAKGTIAVTPGATLIADGVMGSTTTSQATNSELTISGISASTTIERDTNDITVIPGFTIKALKTGTATLTIGNDVSATTAKVREVVDSYNELLTYINENDIITRQEDGNDVNNIFGPLASTTIDENLLTAIRNSLGNSTYTGGSKVRIYADLGIETQRDGSLLLKEDIFATAMAEESASVNAIFQNFADDAGTFSGSIAQYIQFNGIIDLATRGNETQIKDLNDRIAAAERSIEQQTATLRQRFARLESLVGQYNSQASALTSALAGLGG